MDQQLISLARAVKRRRRARHPTLWLFTDERRLADPCAVIARLPRGMSGVVFRHDRADGRVALARRVARLCRSRRIVLVVAGDWRLAAACHAGLHLRRGQSVRTRYHGPLVTASAHDRAELVAARRAGAALVFLSPAFATVSHIGDPTLGPVRWAMLARSSRLPVLALGGVASRAPKRLGSCCAGVGAIGSFGHHDPIK